jgi:hypothetical protein
MDAFQNRHRAGLAIDLTIVQRLASKPHLAIIPPMPLPSATRLC